MRVALGQHPVATHEYLTFAKQLGVGGVQLNMIGKEIDLIGEVTDLPADKGYLDASYLQRLKQKVNDYDLRWKRSKMCRAISISTPCSLDRVATRRSRITSEQCAIWAKRAFPPGLELDAEPGLAHADGGRARRRNRNRIRHGTSAGRRGDRRHH